VVRNADFMVFFLVGFYTTKVHHLHVKNIQPMLIKPNNC